MNNYTENPISAEVRAINISQFMSANFVLYTFNGRVWQGSTKDAQATAENNAAQGADADASYVIKKLFADEPIAKTNKRHWDGLRNFFYSETLPYSTVDAGAKKGPRLLPATSIIKFGVEFERRLQQALGTLHEMEKHYPEILQRSMLKQGNMMNIDDYPPVSKLKELFAAQIVPTILAENASVDNVNIPASHVGMFTDKVVAGQQTAITSAMDNLKQRMTDELIRIVEQMGKFHEVSTTNDKRVERDGDAANKIKLPQMHATLVSNISKLNGILSSSNVSGSEELDEICQGIERELCDYGINEVKAKPALAKDKLDVAQDMLKRLAKVDIVNGGEAVTLPSVTPVPVDTQVEDVPEAGVDPFDLESLEDVAVPVATQRDMSVNDLNRELIEEEESAKTKAEKAAKRVPELGAIAEVQVGDTELADAIDGLFDL